MRIAHVTLDGGMPRYGIGLAVVALARAQARAGDDVLLLVREENAADARAAAPETTVVGLVRRRGLLGGRGSYVRQVRRALARGVDVVHVHSLVRIAAWLLPPRARQGAPLVVTAHAADELGPAASPSGDATPARARRHARQAKRVLREARVVVAPSRFAAGLVAAAGRTGPLVVVGHGPTDDRAPPRPPRDGFVVLALARFVPVKGLDVLLEGFALAFPEPASRARLVLAGDGPARDTLARRAQALGIGDRVEWPGYVAGAARAALLARADVVAVPTRGDYETFGLAALDARAAGSVALVASGGALPERVAEGGGLVVAGAGASDWALALRSLRDEPGRVPAPDPVAVRSRESWDVAAAAHRRVYEGARAGAVR